MKRRSLYVGASALLVMAACRDREGQRRAAVGNELPPLVVSSSTTTLTVEGFGEAVVSLPVSAKREMPVVVAVLGIGDNPEDQCGVWRDIVGPRAFVLCPRGERHVVLDEPEGVDAGRSTTKQEENVRAAPSSSDGDAAVAVAAAAGRGSSYVGSSYVASWNAGSWNAGSSDAGSSDAGSSDAGSSDAGRWRYAGFYPVDLPTLEREVMAALAALRRRWGAYVSEREVVYAGFSRGAFLGATLAARHPERFTRLVLIEGGQSPWTAETAAAFARGGGRRVLFACGQPKCVEESEPAASLLRAQSTEVRIVHGAGEGHGYRKQVKEEVRRAFDWVMEGSTSPF